MAGRGSASWCRHWSNKCRFSVVLNRKHRLLRQSEINHVSCRCGSTAVKMPALSPTMTEGSIKKWYKNEGDTVEPGDALCDIETDKAVVTFEYEDEGILAKILKPENSKDIKLGTLIAVVVDEGDDWKNAEIPVVDEPAVDASKSPDPPSPVTVPSAPAPVASAPQSGTQPHHEIQNGIGPAIRTLQDTFQFDLNDVKPTGPHDRPTKGDVLKLIKEKGLKAMPPVAIPLPQVSPVNQVKPTPPKSATPPKVAPPISATTAPPEFRAQAVETSAYVDLPLSSMRNVIAKRLSESKWTIPHSYATIDCTMDELLALRKDLKNSGNKLSVNDFIVKAAAVALKTVPEMNAVWSGEGANQLDDIDICIAVATDNGLITPIIKDALGKGVRGISDDSKELAAKARDGKLQPHEYQGGSFTISNLGMFGITEFTAVINPPQVGILAVGTSRSELQESGKVETKMKVTLSHDRRVIDENVAASFLEAFKEVMESPAAMLAHFPSKTGDANMEHSSMKELAKKFASFFTGKS